MHTRNLVEFTGQAAATVPERCQQQFGEEIAEVARAIVRPEEPLAVTVGHCFTSFTPDFERRTVFGIEVRTAHRFHTHIVKVGLRDEVERDWTNWQQCTSRGVASRILAPCVPVPLIDKSRFAVVYQDGYTLFGPNRETDRPENLEIVAGKAIREGTPSLPSVVRTVAHVFTDLGRWFYPSAASEQLNALAFYDTHLKRRLTDRPSTSGRPQTPVLDLWLNDPARCDLRRDVVWVTCGRDKPDLDPAQVRYLDPVEYVGWAVAAVDGSRLPDTLVGPAHGDLHARNVLLGVRRGEAEYPVVFDYGAMGLQNVPAWDFAKLEVELVRRLLPPLLEDDATRERLAADSRLRPMVQQEFVAATPLDRERTLDRLRMADRIRATVNFFELLHEFTTRIQSEAHAEQVDSSFAPTGLARIDRLLNLLWHVRREAAYWLGYKPGRKGAWRDELYFALTVYGLVNVRWNYDPPESEVALVGAGVAAARMRSTPQLLESEVSQGDVAAGPFPSYRVPLAILHRMWERKEFEQAAAFITREVTGNDCARVIGPAYRHAVPLVSECLLGQMEVGNFGPAEVLLDGHLRPLARQFGDYETLGRLGRHFKQAGDRLWHESLETHDRFATTTGWQMYKKAFTIYAEAYAATADRYVGINAATLAFLTHDLPSAKRLAEEVARMCADLHDHTHGDRYWLFATEGEAAVLRGPPHLNSVPNATGFFRAALAELTPGQGGKADSSYKQLCRLWKALGPIEGEERIGPLLELFEKSRFRSSLSAGFLGRVMSPDPHMENPR